MASEGASGTVNAFTLEWVRFQTVCVRGLCSEIILGWLTWMLLLSVTADKGRC